MIRRTEFYLPTNPMFTTAFERVNNIYEHHNSPAAMKNLPSNFLSELVSDYFFAACAFLKIRLVGTPIEAIGQSAWGFVEHPSSRLIITTDIRETLTQPDIAAIGQIRGLRTPPFQPKMLLDEFKHQPDETEPTILITPDFVIRSQKYPADVIAGTASAMSYFYDWTNEAVLSTNDARQRSQAVKASILIEAMKEDPGLFLSAPDRVLLTRYPKGISTPHSKDIS
jgi:hypothetical protein